MKRNRRNNIKRERIIMIASSAFVLAALTMTGVYMKDKTAKVKDDGYTIDFSTLENSVDDKYEEIAKNNTESQAEIVNEDDLDYIPMEEAGSGLVEIPGLTDTENANELAGLVGSDAPADAGAEVSGEEEKVEVSTGKADVGKTLHFAEDTGLLKPAAGDIVMHYSMDKSIYFATLDQYKYNPAVMIGATEGGVVNVCAEGKVLEIFENEEIGQAVTLDLGDGYQATYGQLKDVQVSKGKYVKSGDLLGYVAAPTKYYSMEGSNVYFQLTKDGAPVNPEAMFQ